MTMIRVANVKDVAPLPDEAVNAVMIAVENEIRRQDHLARAGRFGGTHIMPSGPDHARLAVLVEEVGEVSREVNEMLMRHTECPHPDDHIEDNADLYEELIQVAAVATAWAAALGVSR